jgi:uncharacterized protein
MAYVPHIVVLALIFVMPAWDYFEAQRLKTSPDPQRRVKWYVKLIVVGVALALVVIWQNGLREVTTINARAPWLPASAPIRTAIVGLITALILMQVVVMFQIRNKPEARAKIAKGLESLSFMLPVTRDERVWFLLVSVVVGGVCEEIIYRGFLIHYLMGAPAGLNVTLAIVVASLIFGIAHIYQGVGGAIGSTILGIVFSVLFVMTGNILLPVVLHALIDARILLILPEGVSFAPAPES